MDEDERITLVIEFHRSQGIDLPNSTLHATIHVVVENQIALDVETVVETEARLIRQGLDRHEVIHAIGAVLTDKLHSALTSRDKFDESQYRLRLKKLSAKRWKKGKW